MLLVNCISMKGFEGLDCHVASSSAMTGRTLNGVFAISIGELLFLSGLLRHGVHRNDEAPLQLNGGLRQRRA